MGIPTIASFTDNTFSLSFYIEYTGEGHPRAVIAA